MSELYQYYQPQLEKARVELVDELYEETDERVFSRILNPVAKDAELEENGVVSLEQRRAEKEKKPLSFNLTAERDRAREAIRSGDPIKIKLARDGFVNNVSYWAKEYLADIHTTHYYWEIEEREGEVLLYHPQYGYSHEMTRNALADNVPEYERQRRRVEDSVDTRMRTEILVGAPEDTSLVWSSPAPEGKANSVYGGYSMTHLYEIRMVNGKKVLAGRDVKNRLSNEAQKELLELYAEKTLFTHTPSSLEILDTIIKPRLGVSTRDIELKIKELEERDGIVADGDEGIRVRAVETSLNKHTLSSEQIFDELSQETINAQEITEHFELLLKDIYRDYLIEKRKYERQDSVVHDVPREDEYYGGMAPIVFEEQFAQQIGGGSCGSGFGFDAGMAQTYSSVFGYVPAYVGYSVVPRYTPEQSCPEIKCGRSGCKWKASDSEVSKIQKGELKCCPKCKWKPGDSKAARSVEKYRKDKESKSGDQKKTA